MTQQSVDLASLFETAAQNLAANQQAINQADGYNGNHGTNMTQTFQTIASALEKKKEASPSAALNYAAKQVGRKATSGSGQIYAQNLSRAAAQFKGRQMDQRGALDLLQTLIGGGQPAAQATAQPAAHTASGDDMLGAMLGGSMPKPSQGQPAAGGADLLGALLGGAGSGQQSQGGDLLGSLLGGMGGSQQSSSSGDMLGSLLGGLSGNQPAQASGQGGLDMGDLLNAGMAFMQAKQSGGSMMQAVVQAFMAGSGMGRSPHREQSTELVVNSFLQALAQGK